jgi:hypothetical protein
MDAESIGLAVDSVRYLCSQGLYNLNRSLGRTLC